ncbi:hypothetical protein AwEntero_09900 [Enterobacterales bacterium]|nr:hypothetical protein AwEntero_09900 [Enterobacterales bacterium]
MTFNRDAQRCLMWLVTGLQCLLDLRQYLFRQIQHDLTLWRKAQWLTFTHEQPETQALLKIAELVRQGRLRLMQLRSGGGQRPGIA